MIADNQAILARSGAIETIIEAININVDDAPICQSACGVLKNMTFNGKKIKIKIKIK